MDIYNRLAITPFINAAGTLTVLGGSIMPLEVVEAMAEASRSYVDLYELHQAAGRRIAELIGVEAAHVCACASAGITLMAAACMAGDDLEKIARLPDTSGMKNRFIVQDTRRTSFDHGVETAGGQIVPVTGDLSRLEQAIDEQTAAVFCTYAWSLPEDDLPLNEVADIAHRRGVPVIVDAAAEVPPVKNLARFNREGADLVAFSGGKAIRGPQASGFILGRASLVAACAANDSPRVDSIARGMKTGKEEIAGLVRAVELYLAQDHAALMAEWERQAAALAGELCQVPGLRAERRLPRGLGQLIPHVSLSWSMEAAGVTVEQLVEDLRIGSPRIAVRPVDQEVWVCVQTLQPGEGEIVARRIKEVFLNRGRAGQRLV